MVAYAIKPRRAAGSAAAGDDLIIFSMRGPYDARLLEPLGRDAR